MKAKTLITLLTCLGFGAAYGIEVYEGFDYADGNLAGNGGTGWNTDWGTFPRGNGINNGIGGEGNVTAVDVQAETILAPVDYTLPRTGGESIGVDGYPSAWREFTAENKISTTDEGTVYFSFLFSMDAVSADQGGSYIYLNLIAADRTDLFRVGVGTGLTTTAIQFPGDDTILSTGREIVPGESYLLIAKLELGPGPDTISAQAYSASETIGSEPESWAMVATKDLDVYGEIDRIGLLYGGLDGDPQVDHTGYIDEVRFGDTFESVFSDGSASGLVASYSFETIVDGEGNSDLTPNDMGAAYWDLGLPVFNEFMGAASAISVGEGRDGGNALSPNLAPGPGYGVPKATALDTEFDNASQFTLLGWYRGSDLGATTGRIFDRMSNSNHDGFFFRVNSPELDARLRVGSGETSGFNTDTPVGFFVSNDTWQFFAVTFDNGNVTFYRGDAATPASVFHSGVNTNTQTGVNSDGPWELTIGTQASSPANALFNGYLDDLQLYNVALSSEEILAVQGADASGKGPGVFSDYDLIDGYVDTDTWMGWVYVADYPWAFVVNLDKYVYIAEPAGWVYIPK